jgi:hypothetical protein
MNVYMFIMEIPLQILGLDHLKVGIATIKNGYLPFPVGRMSQGECNFFLP